MSHLHRTKPLPVGAAAVVGASPTITVAARRLSINPSTVYRWVQAGKVPRPGRRRRAAVAAGKAKTPAGWARWVLAVYELDATERLLLDSATRALRIARDPAVAPAVQLAALGRFQALVRQLNFDGAAADETKTDTSIQAAAWRRA